MRKIIWGLMLAWVTLGSACRASMESQTTSPMDPHYQAQGPWFEGWYTHLVDEAGKLDIAVVNGSFASAQETFSTSPFIGYAALVIHDWTTGRTTTHEVFPAHTQLEADGAPVRANPDDRTPANFRWSADGLGSMSQNAIDLQMPGGVAFHAKFASPLAIHPLEPWLGPEGLAAKLPFIWSHWFIYSTASATEYTYQVGNTKRAGQAFSHMEKNYGSGFPSAWVWMHALGDQGRSHLSLAGGPAPISLAHPEVWSVILQTSQLDWAFFPGLKDLTVQRQMQPCTGSMQITLWNPQRRLEVQANSAPDQFVGIATPSPQGWIQAGAHESYAATIKVDAFDLNMFGKPTLRQHLEFAPGVLEFGGAFRCPTVKL